MALTETLEKGKCPVKTLRPWASGKDRLCKGPEVYAEQPGKDKLCKGPEVYTEQPRGY